MVELNTKPTKEEAPIVDQRLSVTGTKNYNGHVWGYELNPKFITPGSWAATARQMIRTHTRIRQLDSRIRQLICSPVWSAEPPTSDEEPNANAVRNADFVNRLFGWSDHPSLMDRTWESTLKFMSTYVSTGYAVMEEVYKYDPDTGWIVLKELGDLEQDSIYKWLQCPETGELEFIEQYPFANGQPPPLPLPSHKALVLTNDRTGNNYEGQGLLRACYKWYRLQMLLMDATGMGGAKWAIPVLRLRTDLSQNKDALGEEIYTPDQIKQLQKNGIEACENFGAGITKYIADTPVVALDQFGDGLTKGFADLLNIIKHANKEMASAYSAQFIDLGIDDTGSRAVGEVHYSDSRAMVLNYIDHIRDQLSGRDVPGGGTVSRMLKMNFYPNGIIPQDEMPIIKHSGLDSDPLSEGLVEFTNLLNLGIFDTKELEIVNKLRSVFRLSPLKEEDLNKPIEQPLEEDEDSVIYQSDEQPEEEPTND